MVVFIDIFEQFCEFRFVFKFLHLREIKILKKNKIKIRPQKKKKKKCTLFFKFLGFIATKIALMLFFPKNCLMVSDTFLTFSRDSGLETS